MLVLFNCNVLWNLMLKWVYESISGFTDVEAACCGLGELNARAPCLPVSHLCPNRQDHIFWDQFHPTEAASRIFVDKIFDGSSTYTSPINMRQLVAAWSWR